MANVIVGNPWVLDTASAVAVKKGRVKVASILWSGYSNASHTMVMKDVYHGTEVLKFTGKTDLSDCETNFGDSVWMEDLALTTLGSGTVYVYIR